jgi:tetratricopeptide (TPR) repeat protein
MEMSRIEDRTLLSAQGYFELGMTVEALAELDSLPVVRQQRSEVLQMRLLIHMTLYQRRPNEALGFIHAAFCLHELGRTAEAKALLLNGPSALLSEPTYHYNLGCYDAALGNIAEAQAHLRVSFKLDKKFREFARTDPDLKGVWSAL